MALNKNRNSNNSIANHPTATHLVGKTDEKIYVNMEIRYVNIQQIETGTFYYPVLDFWHLISSVRMCFLFASMSMSEVCACARFFFFYGLFFVLFINIIIPLFCCMPFVFIQTCFLFHSHFSPPVFAHFLLFYFLSIFLSFFRCKNNILLHFIRFLRCRQWYEVN